MQNNAFVPQPSISYGSTDAARIKQTPSPVYRDVTYAKAFLCQLFAVFALAAYTGRTVLQLVWFSGWAEPYLAMLVMFSGFGGPNMDMNEASKSGIISIDWALLGVTVASSIAATVCSLALMVTFPSKIVNLCFVMGPTLTIGIALLAYVEGRMEKENLIKTVAGNAAVCGIMYSFSYNYIPFAAATLKTSLVFLKQFAGLYVLSFAFSFLSFAWFFLWVLAIIGVAVYSGFGLITNMLTIVGLVIFLIVSLFWTLQTIKNILFATTVGVVGTWWFEVAENLKDRNSRIIYDTLKRVSTYSLGSICLGSLFAAISELLSSAERNNKSKFDSLLKYFNSWTFVYVGLYGYDYVTAGKTVISSARERGWSSLLSDRLVFRVLLACNFIVSLGSGCLACLVTARQEVFFVAFLIGLFVSSTVVFVVNGTVRTIIVCYAENANEFNHFHPKLAQEMMLGWSQVYPKYANDSSKLKLV